MLRLGLVWLRITSKSLHVQITIVMTYPNVHVQKITNQTAESEVKIELESRLNKYAIYFNTLYTTIEVLHIMGQHAKYILLILITALHRCQGTNYLQKCLVIKL